MNLVYLADRDKYHVEREDKGAKGMWILSSTRNGKMGEKPKYTGRILAVGISYSTKTKEHSCKVEVL